MEGAVNLGDIFSAGMATVFGTTTSVRVSSQVSPHWLPRDRMRRVHADVSCSRLSNPVDCMHERACGVDRARVWFEAAG